MVEKDRKPLEYYQGLEYRFVAHADPDGGYVIEFPDLLGCLTQVESIDEIPDIAEAAKRTWIEGAYELGREVPLPSYTDLESYSGKFIMRVPKSLHRKLAEQARENGVSLNSWVMSLLAERSADARVTKPGGVRQLAPQEGRARVV